MSFYDNIHLGNFFSTKRVYERALSDSKGKGAHALSYFQRRRLVWAAVCAAGAVCCAVGYWPDSQFGSGTQQ